MNLSPPEDARIALSDDVYCLVAGLGGGTVIHHGRPPGAQVGDPCLCGAITYSGDDAE